MEEVKEVTPTAEEAQAVAAEAQAVTEPSDAQEKGGFKQYFTARRIAYIAMFTALSLALRFL